MNRSLTISLCLLMLSAYALGQHRLVITSSDELPNWLENEVKLASTQEAESERSSILSSLYRRGYLAASFDTCTSNGNTTTCKLSIGPEFKWADLRRGSMDVEIATAARFREKLYRDATTDPVRTGRMLERVLKWCENNGFPFARIRLDSVQMVNEGIMAAVDLNKGPLVTMDSVVIKGKTRTSARLLQDQIGIRTGDMYDESLIMGVEARLKELPFIKVQRAPYVLFTEDQTKLFLFLEDKKASSINGILGVLPDAITGKVTITGDLDLRLANALRNGERIALNWRSLQDQTQELKINFNYPFLFNTPFGTDLSLELFKRDTTFLELNTRAGLELLLRRGDKVGAFVNNKTSDRLGNFLTQDPTLADVKLLLYGLNAIRSRFDDRLNPRRGYGFELEGSVGTKRSQQGSIADQSVTEEVKTTQYAAEGDIAWHIGIGKKGTVRLGARGGSMVNDKLFPNELFRIGGIKSMRGVDEASIFASSFAVGTLEYRFLYEERSNLFLFVDQGWWEDQAALALRTDDPIGFGIGTNFETKAGIFSLTYALGQQFNNPVEFRSGKIHFGFLSIF